MQYTLNYSISEESCWFMDTITNTDGSMLSNFRMDPRQVEITNIRNIGFSEFNLDSHGFQFLHNNTYVSIQSLIDNNMDVVKEQYYPEIEKLIKTVIGGNLKVVFFDSTVRTIPAEQSKTSDPNKRKPVFKVHVDQTPISAHNRIKLSTSYSTPSNCTLTDEGDEEEATSAFPYKRFQIINVWRPLNVVKDYPLAVADYRSVSLENDMKPTKLFYPDWLKDKETYSVKWNPNHKWYFVNEMTPDEVVLFKCYDSKSKSLAQFDKRVEELGVTDESISGFCHHSSFFTGQETLHTRISIEVRALVFHLD